MRPSSFGFAVVLVGQASAVLRVFEHHGRALLADFGIAQSANKTGMFAPSIGTLRYMSPEQLAGRESEITPKQLPTLAGLSTSILAVSSIMGSVPIVISA